MTRARRRRGAEARSWPVVVASLAVFVLLGSLSLILAAVGVRVVPEAATSSHGVPLLKAPRHAATILLPATARPVTRARPRPPCRRSARPRRRCWSRRRMPASEPSCTARSTSPSPQVIPYQGARPTLGAARRIARVHRGRSRALRRAGHAVRHHRPADRQRLRRVGRRTRPRLATPGSAPWAPSTWTARSSGSASIVTWGGGLSFTGTAAQPLTDRGLGPDHQFGRGRPRAPAGRTSGTSAA